MEKRYNRLADALKKKGKTNRWLSEQLEVSETTVSRWAHNVQQPAIPMLYRIAEKLGIEARSLLARMKDVTVTKDGKARKG